MDEEEEAAREEKDEEEEERREPALCLSPKDEARDDGGAGRGARDVTRVVIGREGEDRRMDKC